MISLYNKQLKLLFIYAITLLIISPSFGQIDSRTTLVKICDFKGGDKADNACGPGTISGIISKNSSKEVEVTLSAYAVNIPVNQEGNDHVFPSEYPALHLRYQYGVDQFKYTESLINWTLVDEIITNNGEIRTLYRSDQKVNLILPENSECAPESSTIIFPIDIRLYTYSAENDEWEDFPIDNYAAPDDIFSCEVFDNTKHICDPKLKPIDLMSTIDI